MECKQCGSKKELYVFKDCCDCECLCKRCLMQSCDVEEVEVKRYVDVNSREVFYNNDDLAEYVVDAGLVEIESEETTAFYDSDTAEYLEDDEDLINYLEEKYDAAITDADRCPECGAVMQKLYLIEDGSERTIMCYDCLLEKYNVEREEIEDEDRIRFHIKDKSMEVETWEAFEDDIFGALEELYEITITEL